MSVHEISASDLFSAFWNGCIKLEMERVSREEVIAIVEELRLGVGAFLSWCDRMCHRYHRCSILGLMLEDGNRAALEDCENQIRC